MSTPIAVSVSMINASVIFIPSLVDGQGIVPCPTLLLEHKLKLMNHVEAFHEPPLVVCPIFLRDVAVLYRHLDSFTASLHLDGIAFLHSLSLLG